MSAIAAVAAPFGRDLREALTRIERLIARARSAGARLVVFPELRAGRLHPRAGAGRGGARPAPGLDPHGPQIERLIALAGETCCPSATPRRRPRACSAPPCASTAMRCSVT